MLQRTIFLFPFLLIQISCYSQSTGFKVHDKNTTATILYDTADFPLVKIAAELLANDIELVTGQRPRLSNDVTQVTKNVIIVGSMDKCKFIKDLVSKKQLSVKELNGSWETYRLKTINKPFRNVSQALVICGSDRRGTAYGVFEISNRIGVSPWYWWADVKPERKETISISVTDHLSTTPSVKYRGIFLNDEDWGLQPWAAKTFEPETGDIGPKTYARIFELLLRLKANLIWPAMHPSTKAFYHYRDNRKVADQYGIIIGSSHAEPMLRNNVDEWNERTMGEFNYTTNREKVKAYWEERIMESKKYENIYTLGMRGIHDSGMKGADSMEEKIDLVSTILSDQREMLNKNINTDVTKIPQAFIPYKEVLEIYDNGLKLPDDVTIVWPDDNYGYIHRLNDPAEEKRGGGSGVYYHISYWGRPHDYLWLSSTHPMLIWEEMSKAYNTKCDRLWVVNVGDIKPMEYNTQLFLDMAYDIRPFSSSNYVYIHLQQWLGSLFGNGVGVPLSDIYWSYYNLSFQRRPEFMGWSQTEPTRTVNFTEFNHFFYNDEAQTRLDQFNKLSKEVRRLKNSIQSHRQDAYYQLVYYPIQCATLMNKKFLHYEKAFHYARQHRTSSNDHALIARQAFDSIKLETDYYNSKLADGKWSSMMSMTPRSLPVFDPLMIPTWDIPQKLDWGISLEGYKDQRPRSLMYGSRLPTFYSLNNNKSFIDLFLTGSEEIAWEATPSHPWIKLSQSSGSLRNEFGKREQRLWVSIDWTHAPRDKRSNGSVLIKGGNKEFTVPFTLDPNGEDASTMFKEQAGYVSMYAENATQMLNGDTGEWQAINGLGYTGKAIMMTPKGQHTVTKNSKNPTLTFDFETSSQGDATVTIYCLPVHAYNTQHQLRIAIRIDNNKIDTVDFRTFDRSETWKQNVLRNSAQIQSKQNIAKQGKHTLTLTALDPGIVIDRITLDFGGLEPAYSTIPETRRK